ncbi:MAG: DUF2271 domain-containing protein [Sphingomonadales bacterium]|nr:DUF2271 domain-containing protein [Sphingomonadales bacterium]MDE2168219.1 DUF2271 domain-containing protein [Sphingomonadales bacterium]
MRPASFVLVAGVLSAPFASSASASTVSVTLPRLALAEYKRPYVAGWIEPATGGAARSLFVWYDMKKAGNEPGTKWLADLRSWWRKSGRLMKLPANGVSGATKGPGTYAIPLPADLTPGHYVVSIEVARENGGRELVSVPVSVPAPNGRASGKSELGAVVVSPR